jgi:hypothetical protein
MHLRSWAICEDWHRSRANRSIDIAVEMCGHGKPAASIPTRMARGRGSVLRSIPRPPPGRCGPGTAIYLHNMAKHEPDDPVGSCLSHSFGSRGSGKEGSFYVCKRWKQNGGRSFAVQLPFQISHTTAMWTEPHNLKNKRYTGMLPKRQARGAHLHIVPGCCTVS